MLLTDIDDRKRAEDALRLNEHDLRLIVDSILGLCLPQMRWARSNSSTASLGYFGKDD